MKSLSHIYTIHLNSEALKKIEYNEKRQILTATFTNNRRYQYKKVPKTTWLEFVKTIENNESAGAFINQKIKPFYQYIEIT